MKNLLAEIETLIEEKYSVKIEDLCEELGIVEDKMNRRVRRFVCDVLREKGWKYTARKDKDGKSIWKWYNLDKIENDKLIDAMGRWKAAKDILKSFMEESRKRKYIAVDDILKEIGYEEGISFSLKKFLCKNLRKEGWEYRTVRIKGKTTKRWVNPLADSPEFLRGQIKLI